MGMVVRTNIMAVNANRQLGMNNSQVSKSIEKLSSGFRINRAGDDASGLAISEKMKAQITALEQAASNSQDGISLIQTAEGALTEVHSMLNRMVELSEKSANGTMDDNIDRVSIQKEVDALTSEIDRISKNTNFNGINLLDGSLGLNKDAFKVSGTPSGALKAKFMEIPDGQFGTVGAATAHLGTKAVTEVKPYFEVDLADLEITTKDVDNTFTLTVSGVAMTATDALGAADTKVGAAALATAVAAKNNTAGAFTLGGVTYTVGASGSKLTFTYAGKDGGATTDGSDPIEDSMNSPSGAVSYAIGGAPGSAVTGDVYHDVIKVTNPVAKVAGERAGIDFTFTAAMIKDGQKLTIDDKTFVFKTKADSKVTLGDGETLINLSAAALDNDDKKMAEAIDLISSSGGSTNFDFTAKSDTVLHIDQKIVSEELYDTIDKLKAEFSITEKAATNVGTEVTVNIAEIKSGNSLNIAGKSYTFVENGNTPVQDGSIAVEKGDGGANAMDNLKAALLANGVKADFADGKLTVYSNDATAKKGPEVFGGGLTLQIGDTSDTFNQISVAVKDMSTKGLNLENLSVKTAADATKALDLVKKGPTSAINQVSLVRADLGAFQNRLEHTINNLDVAAENMTSANSRIRDTDMAKEMMNYTKMNVLTQAAQAMLAQANQQPQAILQLLQ